MEKQCEVCEQYFKHKTSVVCSIYCRNIKKNRDINKRWLERDIQTRRQDPRRGTQLEYARLAKKGGSSWLRKFNACRG